MEDDELAHRSDDVDRGQPANPNYSDYGNYDDSANSGSGSGSSRAFADESDRVPSVAPESDSDMVRQFQKMPMVFMGVLIFYIVLAPITMLKPTSLQSGSGFLGNQMAINSSLVVTLSVVYGMMTLAFPKAIVTKFRNIILPLVLIVCMWIKGLATYRNSLIPFCKSKYSDGKFTANTVPYRSDILIWNTSKVPLAIFVTYVFVVLFPQTATPFYEFFCGEGTPHPLVEFFSIGVWVGCATWASEASCYFEIMRDGCQPADNVDFAYISEKIQSYDDGDDADDADE
jgi:hypothetical protein